MLYGNLGIKVGVLDDYDRGVYGDKRFIQKIVMIRK